MRNDNDLADLQNYKEQLERQWEESKKFQPTHFIEWYVPNDYKLEKHSIDYPLVISHLEDQLKTTKKLGLKTIAIFKIQFK